MSVENTAVAENLNGAAPFVPSAGMDDDAALGAIWDQNERDNGAVRGDDGKFTSPQPNKADDAPAEANSDATKPPLEGGGGGEAEQNAVSTPDVPQTPLPANWKGSDGKVRADLAPIWDTLTPEHREVLAKQQSELHTRMSDQGRQLGALKPLQEVLDRHRDIYEGKRLPSGELATREGAVDLLMNAQRKIAQNPVRGILELADMYKVRDHIAAALGQAQYSPQQQQPADTPTSAQIAAYINEVLAQERAVQKADSEVDRLSQDKPFFSEIPEAKMVKFINMAREDLESQGEAASIEAVFNLAYDMAVYADPTLRAKAAAANAPKPKPAAQPDPKKTEGAKRANSVNLTSTASGKAPELSEDELLSQIYDAAQKG